MQLPIIQGPEKFVLDARHREPIFWLCLLLLPGGDIQLHILPANISTLSRTGYKPQGSEHAEGAGPSLDGVCLLQQLGTQVAVQL